MNAELVKLGDSKLLIEYFKSRERLEIHLCHDDGTELLFSLRVRL